MLLSYKFHYEDWIDYQFFASLRSSDHIISDLLLSDSGVWSLRVFANIVTNLPC